MEKKVCRSSDGGRPQAQKMGWRDLLFSPTLSRGVIACPRMNTYRWDRQAKLYAAISERDHSHSFA